MGNQIRHAYDDLRVKDAHLAIYPKDEEVLRGKCTFRLERQVHCNPATIIELSRVEVLHSRSVLTLSSPLFNSTLQHFR